MIVTNSRAGRRTPGCIERTTGCVKPPRMHRSASFRESRRGLDRRPIALSSALAGCITSALAGCVTRTRSRGGIGLHHTRAAFYEFARAGLCEGRFHLWDPLLLRRFSEGEEPILANRHVLPCGAVPARSRLQRNADVWGDAHR
jgi:hypothetical protein